MMIMITIIIIIIIIIILHYYYYINIILQFWFLKSCDLLEQGRLLLLVL